MYLSVCLNTLLDYALKEGIEHSTQLRIFLFAKFTSNQTIYLFSSHDITVNLLHRTGFIQQFIISIDILSLSIIKLKFLIQCPCFYSVFFKDREEQYWHCPIFSLQFVLFFFSLFAICISTKSLFEWKQFL